MRDGAAPSHCGPGDHDRSEKDYLIGAPGCFIIFPIWSEYPDILAFPAFLHGDVEGIHSRSNASQPSRHDFPAIFRRHEVNPHKEVPRPEAAILINRSGCLGHHLLGTKGPGGPFNPFLPGGQLLFREGRAKNRIPVSVTESGFEDQLMKIFKNVFLFLFLTAPPCCGRGNLQILTEQLSA